MTQFIKPSDDLNFNTKKGEIIFDKNEYFIIQDGNREILMINKIGIQKICDFFDITFDIPNIQQAWISPQNFNIICTILVNSKYGQSVGVASGNPLNLTNQISAAYATEMAVKRSKATACLEILRQNYIGEETLPLLYSDYDEFKADNSINNAKEKNENKKDVQTNLNNFILKTKKYINGISFNYLLKNDKQYLYDLATLENKYQNITLKFLNSKNISINDLSQEIQSIEKSILKEENTSKEDEQPIEENTSKEDEQSMEENTSKEDEQPMEENTSKEDKQPIEENTSKEDDNSIGNEIIKPSKYKSGITFNELLKNDKEFLIKISSKPNRFRDKALEFLKEKNITIDDLKDN